jgi:hypothetical protein
VGASAKGGGDASAVAEQHEQQDQQEQQEQQKQHLFFMII